MSKFLYLKIKLRHKYEYTERKVDVSVPKGKMKAYLFITREMVEGLAHLHCNKVIHRDLKVRRQERRRRGRGRGRSFSRFIIVLQL